MTKFFGSLTLAAIAAVVTPQALKADAPPPCFLGNAIMRGTYVANGTGAVIGVGPITAVSLLVYNGDGTGTQVFNTRSLNGAASTATNIPASFTVNPDCTGSKTIGATQFNFVITPDGSTITWIVTNPGVTLSGTGIRLKKYSFHEGDRD
jgi:hypothetical protein